MDSTTANAFIISLLGAAALDIWLNIINHNQFNSSARRISYTIESFHAFILPIGWTTYIINFQINLK